jgi:predicted lipid-binding transport protein (Tim44 family)
MRLHGSRIDGIIEQSGRYPAGSTTSGGGSTLVTDHVQDLTDAEAAVTAAQNALADLLDKQSADLRAGADPSVSQDSINSAQNDLVGAQAQLAEVQDKAQEHLDLLNQRLGN